MTPEEPPVGTVLTAPKSRFYLTRHDDGWRVTSKDDGAWTPTAPPGDWRGIHHNLTALGGILTVTTEYQVEYRLTDENESRHLAATLGGFLTRAHITRWAASMQGANAVEILRVQSQQVTRSAWTDEPLEDPK